MNLQIFLDLTYNPCKNFKFYTHQGNNVQIFLIFNYNQGNIFLTLPITGLHCEFPPALAAFGRIFQSTFIRFQ